MKAEDAKKIADTALQQLAAALNAGKSEQLTKYLSMLAKFHRYSWGNVMLITCQRPDASHVAGFTTWKSLGRFVRKGEKGIVILAPMSIRPNDDEQTTDIGKPTKPILRFRAVHVFDVSQTDGQDLPEFATLTGDPADHFTRLKGHVAHLGIVLDYDNLRLGADGVSRGGHISVRHGLRPALEFSVLVHELAHELLHKGEDRPESKTVRETEAEAGVGRVSKVALQQMVAEDHRHPASSGYLNSPILGPIAITALLSSAVHALAPSKKSSIGVLLFRGDRI